MQLFVMVIRGGGVSYTYVSFLPIKPTKKLPSRLLVIFKNVIVKHKTKTKNCFEHYGYIVFFYVKGAT